MLNIKLKGISVIRYAFIFRFLKQLGFRYNPFSSTVLTWGNKSNIKKGKVICVEDGFIRSVGLGVHFNQPLSLVFDYSGIYFDSTKKSDLENILNNTLFNKALCDRASHVQNELIRLGISKYNVGGDANIILPSNKVIILVPGQVEGDASLEFGSPVIKKNQQLLTKVRQANPDAYIIYKPHPDVIVGERDHGNWKLDLSELADLIITDVSIDRMINIVDEVHTITSLAGFEALLRGKKVITYGMPFYAGWGLTVDMENCVRRKRVLLLEELIAGTLILYPKYLDPYSRKLCTVERVIDIIDEQRKITRQPLTIYQHLLLLLKKVKQTYQVLLIRLFRK
jgi:capsular polysaccharide export protein